MLLPTGAVAAFGVGLLALSFSMPRLALPPLSPPAARAVAPAPQVEAPALPDWVALFGQPQAPEPPPAEPLPEVEPPTPALYEPTFDPDLYVLRGLVEDADGGYALLETQDGLAVYRPGDRLPDGERVLTITSQGIEIEAYGEIWLIAFGPNATDPGDMPGRQGFDETGFDLTFPDNFDDPAVDGSPAAAPAAAAPEARDPPRRGTRAPDSGQRPFGMPALPQVGTFGSGTNGH